MSSSAYELTPCQLVLEWTGSGKPTSMREKVILAGSKGPKYFFIQYPPPPSASEQLWLSSHALLELKGCFNPAVVIPVAVLDEIAIEMQVTIGCKGIVDYRWQPFGCKLSSVCDVVVQDWNVHTNVAYTITCR